MKDHFPDDPLLSHFSRRFAQPGFDPTAIRPIISPATQARPKQVQNIEAPFPLQGSPPSQNTPNIPLVLKNNSPKRPLPLEDSDNDSERPRKFARAERGESPQLKGAAGRRLDQQKRNQQSQGTPQFDQVLLQPPPPSLPRDIMFLLSILPNAKAYPPIPRFIPEKVIEHVRLANLQNAQRVHPVGGPPPPQQQQRMQQPPPRIPQPMPLQNMAQMPSMQPISSVGMQNLYNGGCLAFPQVHTLLSSTPRLPQHFLASIRPSKQTFTPSYPVDAGDGGTLRSPGYGHGYGIAAPQSFSTSAIAGIPPSWQQSVKQDPKSTSLMTTAAIFRKLSEDLQKYQ